MLLRVIYLQGADEYDVRGLPSGTKLYLKDGIALCLTGMRKVSAAIGVHPSTFYRWLKDGEEAKTGVKRALYDELKGAESERKRNLLTTIKSAAESRAQFWTAAAWLLERKYPDEYAQTTRKTEADTDDTPHITLGVEVRVAGGDGDGDD